MPRCEARLAGGARCEAEAAWSLERDDGTKGLVCWAHRPRDPAGYVGSVFVGATTGKVVPIGVQKRRLRVVR